MRSSEKKIAMVLLAIILAVLIYGYFAGWFDGFYIPSLMEIVEFFMKLWFWVIVAGIVVTVIVCVFPALLAVLAIGAGLGFFLLLVKAFI